MQGLNKKTKEDIDEAMGRVLSEAMDDDTFRKVQRASYTLHAPDDVSSIFMHF